VRTTWAQRRGVSLGGKTVRQYFDAAGTITYVVVASRTGIMFHFLNNIGIKKLKFKLKLAVKSQHSSKTFISPKY